MFCKTTNFLCWLSYPVENSTWTKHLRLLSTLTNTQWKYIPTDILANLNLLAWWRTSCKGVQFTWSQVEVNIWNIYSQQLVTQFTSSKIRISQLREKVDLNMSVQATRNGPLKAGFRYLKQNFTDHLVSYLKLYLKLKYECVCVCVFHISVPCFFLWCGARGSL